MCVCVFVSGLYRGVVPTVQRAALLTGTQLGTYDEIKQRLLGGGLFREGPLLHFCSGSIAGLVSRVSYITLIIVVKK
jgi:solute carrier family 25 protein 14/30